MGDYYDEVWMRTVTVVEKEKTGKPVLYDHKGTPLQREPPKVGFQPPPKPKKR